MDFYELSSKDGENVHEMFLHTANKISTFQSNKNVHLTLNHDSGNYVSNSIRERSPSIIVRLQNDSQSNKGLGS